MNAYIVATVKPWNVAAFHRHVGSLPGSWTLIETPNALTVDFIDRIKPRFVFFPHWSWKVPQVILGRATCVCFHMSDVPYGRGGSPLQNLVMRGHRETVVSALRMVPELDAGPVYLRQPLLLAGSAQAIYERMADVIFEIIGQIVRDEPEPSAQIGTPVVFSRRTPEQSELPKSGTMASLYDFIRMLDAETYPRAFIDWGEFRAEFSDAEIDADTVTARVVLRKA
jgi:methionyl-tRNA formyltransferase